MWFVCNSLCDDVWFVFVVFVCVVLCLCVSVCSRPNIVFVCFCNLLCGVASFLTLVRLCECFVYD